MKYKNLIIQGVIAATSTIIVWMDFLPYLLNIMILIAAFATGGMLIVQSEINKENERN